MIGGPEASRRVLPKTFMNKPRRSTFLCRQARNLPPSDPPSVRVSSSTMAHTVGSSSWSSSTSSAASADFSNRTGGWDSSLIEEHSVPVTFGLLACMACASLTVAILQRRAARLRAEGQTSMRIWCWTFNLVVSRPDRVTPAAAEEMREQVERSALQSIEMLPVHLHDASTSSTSKEAGGGECALCMDDFKEGEEIMLLPCSHAFHRTCCTRWLVEGQRFKTRRCPLCNLDPLAAMLPTETSSSPQQRNVESVETASADEEGSSQVGSRGTRTLGMASDSELAPVAV